MNNNDDAGLGELSWNAAGPDPELVKLVESGTVPIGRAVDLGASGGQDTIYLSNKGFKVLAVDISPDAVERARANAKAAKTGAAIDFRVEDALKLSSTPGSATFVNDRGCFRGLGSDDFKVYVRRVGDVLFPGGLLFLRTFSDQEPDGPGPHRFSRKELEDLFSARFDFLEFKEGVFEGPGKSKAFVCLLEKKA